MAASATVGSLGREGDLIRMTIIPYYCLFAGGLAFVLINGIGLNAGTVLLVALAVALAVIVTRLARQAPSDRFIPSATSSARMERRTDT